MIRWVTTITYKEFKLLSCYEFDGVAVDWSSIIGFSSFVALTFIALDKATLFSNLDAFRRAANKERMPNDYSQL